MKFSLASALIVGSVVVSAIPMEGAQIFKRGLESPDGTCGTVDAGAGKGYKCPTGYNQCCSKWGWCGSSPEHCGTGCQSEFGSCKQGLPIPDKVIRKPDHAKKNRKTCPRPSKPGQSGQPGTTGVPKPSFTATGTSGPKPSGSSTVTSAPTRSPSSISHTSLPTTTAPLTSTRGTPAPSPSATGPETVTSRTATSTPSPVPTGTVPTIPFGEWIYSCNKPGDIALTFDDGPAEKTPKLIELLNAAGMKATFFLNGDNWVGDVTNNAEYTALLQKMVADGHQIGSHTFHHENLDEISADAIKSTMGKVDSWLVSAIGKKPTYMRPPYFACETSTCQSTIKELGYHMFNADLDTKDYENNTEELIGNAIKTFDDALTAADKSTKSFVVLMHDVHATTVDILVPAAIDTIKKLGFRAVTLGECLGDPASNWYKSA